MTNGDPLATSSSADSGPSQSPGPGESAELDRLAHALSLRFEPHVQAAAAAVRAAEQDLAEASERLEQARQEAAEARYRSDPLVFMRASVKDEVEALGRKTTEKKARAAYRYLVDRAVELAEGEVRGFATDQAAADRERQEGVDARVQAERDAHTKLEAAREMQGRVLAAEQWANEGLGLMVQKLAAHADME